jgi:hypothetical protein
MWTSYRTIRRGTVDQQDLERIARKALNELGVSPAAVTVVETAARPGVWRIVFGGSRELKITCGPGSSPQWVREQIFDQFHSQ